MEIIEQFKDRLKRALTLRKMRQVDLVEKTGLDKTLINKYLSGINKAKQDKLTILADALDVNEVWLMGYDVPLDRDYGKVKREKSVTMTDNLMAPILGLGDVAIFKNCSNFLGDGVYLFKLNGELLVRKLVKIGEDFELQLLAPNDDYIPKQYKKGEIEILGKVIKSENTSAFKF
ncbi:MAG: helix-turn-helix domain-containing protein [Clostridia bacterium]|jgi:transcriptional regulator with XRE-family HTH domain|nr:helix-turn-helix domain-containing protein [Clostridia bacterium]